MTAITSWESLNAGSNPDKAQAVFAAAIKHRPRIRPPIRQRMRVRSSGRCRLNECSLVNHIRDAAIIRTNQNDSVVAFLHKKQMGPGLRHFFPGQGWQLG